MASEILQIEYYNITVNGQITPKSRVGPSQVVLRR
jgi:hypothetical protein